MSNSSQEGSLSNECVALTLGVQACHLMLELMPAWNVFESNAIMPFRATATCWVAQDQAPRLTDACHMCTHQLGIGIKDVVGVLPTWCRLA